MTRRAAGPSGVHPMRSTILDPNEKPASVSGSVNANVVGTYTLTYTATDPSGNVGTAPRTLRLTPR